MKLAVSASPARKIVTAVLAAAIIAAGTYGVYLFSVHLGFSWTLVVVWVKAAAATAAGAWAVAVHSVHLDGTVVTVRRIFFTKVVDLSTARGMWFGARMGGGGRGRGLRGRSTRELPHLVVLPARSHGAVRVPLSTLTTAMPPGQRDALAAAVETARGLPRARWVAGELRAWE